MFSVSSYSVVAWTIFAEEGYVSNLQLRHVIDCENQALKS